MTEVTLSRLQAHSRQRQKALGVGLREDRKQGGGLGSCSSSAVQVGDCEHTGEPDLGGEYSKSTHQPPFYCTAGWLGLGHLELSSVVGRSCQHAETRNISVGTRETGVL